MWADDRQILHYESILWNAEQELMHIFLKELLAATLLIEFLCQHYSCSVLRIGIDNSAAAWCLRRLFSTTYHGQELIYRVYRALSASSNVLEIFQLVSLDNPADVPTRPKTSSGSTLSERSRRFWDVVDGRKASTHRPNNSASEVRHQELEDDDGFESDDDENEKDPDEEFWETMSIVEDEGIEEDCIL